MVIKARAERNVSRLKKKKTADLAMVLKLRSLSERRCCPAGVVCVDSVAWFFNADDVSNAMPTASDDNVTRSPK